jgi:hypothetical protein
MMASASSRWRTALAAISLLVIGATAGIAGDRLIQSHGHAGDRRLADVHHDPLGAIDRAVQLTPDQRTRVAAILERRQPDINAVWADTHVRLQATVDSVVSEIAAVLEPEQARRFRAAADELHGRRRGPLIHDRMPHDPR